MKSILYERQKTLATCVPLLISGLVLSLHPARAPMAVTTSSIEVLSADDPGSDDAAQSIAIEEVREALEPLLADRKDGPALAAVRDLLLTLYRDDVTEIPVPLFYYWYWDGEKWVYYCSGGATFELDLGVDGDVLVDVRDTMLLR